MLALFRNPRLARRKSNSTSSVELSERKLEKVLNALSLPVREAESDRVVRRVRVQAVVKFQPFLHGRYGRARSAKIHDISAEGVAVILNRPAPIGMQFKLLVPRRFRRSIEVLCTVRHCRAEGERFIVGAEYGVSWLETVGALIGPTKMSEAIARRAWEEAATAEAA